MKLLIPAGILKAAITYIGKDWTRHNINGLLFEDGKVIAANSHSLLVWKYGARLSEKGESPNFFMPFNKASIKFVKTANKGLVFHYDTKTHILRDGYGQSILLEAPPDIKFPDWRNVMPDRQALMPITLTISTEIIINFAEYAKVRMGKGEHGFTVLTAGADKAFYLMPYEFADCFIVAMPINSKQTFENHLATICKVSGDTREDYI